MSAGDDSFATAREPTDAALLFAVLFVLFWPGVLDLSVRRQIVRRQIVRGNTVPTVVLRSS